jgi:recombinase/resolvase-like protein
MTRRKDRGLVYIRRSTDRQAISLPAQIEWALGAARQQDVVLDASVADLEHMQALGLHTYKAIRMDDGVTGADMTRPGFLAVNRDALADRSISHVFIYKRDRFARPDDALPLVQIEKKLLESGITVVLSDGVSSPYAPGRPDIGRDIGLMFGYFQGGEELRKHAERVLCFQKKLAEGGFRTGGNPPYGFARVLIDGAGNALEKLPPGKTVHQAGCHVRVVPDDPAKIAVWLQILELKAKGWGLKRIAHYLNDRGIPSPDAGRTRTDHGVAHRVTGRWNHNSVAELCRNPAILGVQQYGKRSEGRVRRLGADGPRLLEEQDRTAEGGPRIVFNDPSLLVARQVGEAQYDVGKWDAIQRQMDERGENQRGVARVKDPARYPLACRVVDLSGGCGSVLYGRTQQGRALYSCGRYMRTAGAECHNNTIDAEALLRFTLKTLGQLVARQGNRDKLRRLLLDRARRAAQDPEASPVAAEVDQLRSRAAVLRNEQATIEYRMAREKDDALYAALARQFSAVQAQIKEVQQAVHRREADQAASASRTPEQEVDAALSLLDDVTRITDDPKARAEVNPLMQRLGVWIGLRFTDGIKGKKRVVRQLQSGLMTFGDRSLPVPLHGPNNVEVGPYGCCGAPSSLPAHDKQGPKDQDGLPVSGSSASAAARDVVREKGRGETQQTGEGRVRPSPAAVGPCEPARPSGSQPEGISFTKVSRGDWIRTSDLLNPIQVGELLKGRFPESFRGSAFLTFPSFTRFSSVSQGSYCPYCPRPHFSILPTPRVAHAAGQGGCARLRRGR